MDREKIVKLIEENLWKIKEGVEYATQSRLFKELGIANDGNGNNTTKNVVSLYVQWEKVDSNSKRIRVTQVIEHPSYTDGRTNNGGAHNVKYANIVKAALLNYTYCEPITYDQLFEKVLGFNRSILKLEFSEKERWENDYYDYFKGYLKSITKNSLDGLQKKKYIIYSDLYMIMPGTNKGLLTPINYKIKKNTCLLTFLRNIWRDNRKVEEFIQLLTPYLKINWKRIHLFDFIKLMRPNKSNRNLIMAFENFTAPDLHQSSVIADCNQRGIIELTENALCEELGIKRKEIGFNSKKASKVYGYASVIYKLLGWKFVWKALDIQVVDRHNGLKEYPIDEFSNDKLLETLEPQIIHWVTVVRVAKPKKHQISREKDDTSKKPYPYLIYSESVNRLHCKIFKKGENPYYLLQFEQFGKS